MGFLKWLGRIFWWIVLWPVGLWRSLRHSRKKGRDQAIKEVRKMRERGEI